MNLNNIFNTFTSEVKEEDKLTTDFKDHPIIKIGMFKKIIKNYQTLGDKMLDLFLSSNINLDKEDMKRAGEYMVYYRAWESIKSLNLENEFHLENLKKTSDKEFIILLDSSIKYFEKFEDYQKCAILHNIQEKVKDFLK